MSREPLGLRRRAMAMIVATIALGCAAHDAETVEPLSCVAPSALRWLPDSSAALCLPPGFRSRGSWSFARRRGDTLPEHYVFIRVEPGVRDSANDRWPLKLSSGPRCLADCTTTESLVVVRDTLAGVPAYIEQGLVSGGIQGDQRVPALVANLDGQPEWTAIVQVRTPSAAVRDSLAAALRTLRVFPQRVQR